MNKPMALQILQENKARMTVGDNWRDIVDPNFYVKAGWPPEWIDEIYRPHATQSGTVFGVWHLDFLRALAKAIGIPESPDLGAYSEARHLAIAIWQKVMEEGEKNEKQ
jgi:hypothetical protein